MIHSSADDSSKTPDSRSWRRVNSAVIRMFLDKSNCMLPTLPCGVLKYMLRNVVTRALVLV